MNNKHGEKEGTGGPLAGNGEPGFRDDGQEGRTSSTGCVDTGAAPGDRQEGSGGAVGPKETLFLAIDQALARKRVRGVFDALSCAFFVAEGFALTDPEKWAIHRDDLAMEALTAKCQRRITRAMKAADPRQGMLALPGYDLVSPLIPVEGGVMDLSEATLGQHRESIAEFAARIKSYEYPRRAPEKLKRDKARLAQERKLDRRIAPLMAGDPEMKMGLGMEMHQAGFESAATKQRRKAIKSRWDQKRAVTKNQ